MTFLEFSCRYCGCKLPAEVRKDNAGMVRIWCSFCDIVFGRNGILPFSNQLYRKRTADEARLP